MHELRNEFNKYKQEEDEKKIEYLIADGRKRLPQIKKMLEMMQ